jgi:hypothetical protein
MVKMINLSARLIRTPHLSIVTGFQSPSLPRYIVNLSVGSHFSQLPGELAFDPQKFRYWPVLHFPNPAPKTVSFTPGACPGPGRRAIGEPSPQCELGRQPRGGHPAEVLVLMCSSLGRPPPSHVLAQILAHVAWRVPISITIRPGLGV